MSNTAAKVNLDTPKGHVYTEEEETSSGEPHPTEMTTSRL
jgi:hypothetical protein